MVVPWSMVFLCLYMCYDLFLSILSLVRALSQTRHPHQFSLRQGYVIGQQHFVPDVTPSIHNGKKPIPVPASLSLVLPFGTKKLEQADIRVRFDVIFAPH